MAIALTGVVAIFVGAAISLRQNADEPTSAADCPSVTVAVPTELLTVVKQEALRAGDDSCAEFQVQAMSNAAVQNSLTDPKVAPDVWIVDNDLWLQSTQQGLQAGGTTIPMESKGSVAQTPIVVAVPKSLASPARVGPKPWLMGLAQIPVTASNPDQSTSSAVAFTAVWQAASNNPLATQVLGPSFMQVVRSSVPEDQLIDNATRGADTARGFPATEQQIWKYNKANPDSALSAMTPIEGAPLNTYEFGVVGSPTGKSKEAQDLLFSQLTSSTAQESLRGNGFRVGALEQPLVDGIPAALPGKTPELDVAEFDRIRSDWSRLSQDIRLLIVTDVSGSMKAPAGTGMRIDMANQAISAAVSQMPDTAQVGLWVFSTNQREGGVDYRELVPPAELGSAPTGVSQREVVLSTAGRFPTMLQGDTGLNDTIWAAFQAEQRNMQPGMQNIVVIMTDGKNDDSTGGLSDDEVIANIKAAQQNGPSPRLVLIGIGTETDEAAMRRITDSVGGTTTIAADPADLSGVFGQAVWSIRPGEHVITAPTQSPTS